MTYTEKELDQFLHGISLSLLSKKSAQHWRYDEETAKEIEWLEVLERKVRADKADRKTEPQIVGKHADFMMIDEVCAKGADDECRLNSHMGCRTRSRVLDWLSHGKEQTMSVYDKVYKAYTDSLKNNFWDAWGIVANPKTIYELKAECLEHMMVFNGSEQAIEKFFGLVVIPCALCDITNVYIVDEQLGRTILGQMERSK